MTEFIVRCPECGTDASALPPCRVCGYRFGCCPCVHAPSPDDKKRSKP